MSVFVLLFVVVGLFALGFGLLYYAFAHRDQPVCATIVDCYEDLLDQITQEPDVIWLATLLRRRQHPPQQSKLDQWPEPSTPVQQRQP